MIIEKGIDRLSLTKFALRHRVKWLVWDNINDLCWSRNRIVYLSKLILWRSNYSWFPNCNTLGLIDRATSHGWSWVLFSHRFSRGDSGEVIWIVIVARTVVIKVWGMIMLGENVDSWLFEFWCLNRAKRTVQNCRWEVWNLTVLVGQCNGRPLCKLKGGNFPYFDRYNSLGYDGCMIGLGNWIIYHECFVSSGYIALKGLFCLLVAFVRFRVRG